ncbi:MAG: ionic transporter y4hA [Burkholderiales bacterium PBB5]|nr:MAG: ionic transporter y4hA [Burkholderiales bacterium PBB5]
MNLNRLPTALPLWSLLLPAASLCVLGGLYGAALGTVGLLVAGAGLVAAVVSAVHHAEVVAHRVGEPFGTLVLAVAVTTIEVALIVSLMLAGGAGATALARDTVFAAIMIICNGVLGLCLLVGGLRHRVVAFRVEGSSPPLAVLVALSGLSLVLPAYTTTTAGPSYSGAQLAFAGVASLVLYGAFVFVQTVRHRDYFLPVGGGSDADDGHAAPPSTAAAWVALALMMAALVAVVGLAKTLAPTLEAAVRAAGAPPAVVGVVVALLVLLPETAAAVRAAAANRLQTSVNLALGSALASIGLTIPAVALLSLWFPHPLSLGLAPKDTVLLVLSFLVGAITLAGGRATVLQGAVHLVLFAAFLFLAVVP